MSWTNLHAQLLSEAFASPKVLGKSDKGAMAFVRCLTPDLVEALATDITFAPKGWQVWRVADSMDLRSRTITADHAVELRESKGDPVLLLVDTTRSGAGMDGIYSAVQEVDELNLFTEALRLAGSEVTQRLSRERRLYAEQAIKKARGIGHRFSISPWTEFDFLTRIAVEKRYPGELFYLIGLWPIAQINESSINDALDLSRFFVEHLLGNAVAGLTPARRIESLKLLNPTEKQIDDLERFLRSSAIKPLLTSLADLAEQPDLWIHNLKVEGSTQSVQRIELTPLRTNTGAIAKWTGLIEGGNENDPPVLILNPNADKTGDYSKLEVRWKTRPDNLTKGAVQYRVAIVTDMDEEVAVHEVSHAAKKEEKCRFTNDDFSILSEDSLINAKVTVSVINSENVQTQESEEFLIRFGSPPEHEPAGSGKKVRTFCEGLIELDNRSIITELATNMQMLPVDSKGFVLLRTSQRGKSFRVFRPSLIQEVETQWAGYLGAIGRWRVRVRASGVRATQPEFVPLAESQTVIGVVRQPLLERVTNVSRRMAERFASCSGVGQIYDEKAKNFDNLVKEYLLAWASLLDGGDPVLALANTVEIQSMSGRTIGLIVLPSHPLRVAWHCAYDNLVLHSRHYTDLNWCILVQQRSTSIWEKSDMKMPS